MNSESDFYESSFFGEVQQRSRPPSIDSDSVGSDAAAPTSTARANSHGAQPACSYYFGMDTLLGQPPYIQEGHRASTASHPLIEDDEDDDVEAPFLRPSSWAMARGFAHVDCHGMPVLKAEDLGAPGDEVGRGGDRGARVYKVHVENLPHPTAALRELVQTANAHKVYQSTVSADEVSYTYVAATAVSAQAAAAAAAAAASGDGKSRRVAGPSLGLRHLVVPAAFVVNAANERKGLLVPLFDGSLAQFLISRPARLRSAATPTGNRRELEGPSPALLPDEGRTNAFLSLQRYVPVESPRVVMAVAYQVLSALVALNDALPHEVEDKGGVRLPCTGYSHNDIYIDNVLLSKREGRVALCDFELVGHLPKNPLRSDMSRFPPPSRTSPRGFFSRTADTWSFALFLLGLVTGVDPLLSNGPLTDDFGDGPLLLPFDSPDRDPEIPVLDWEANIKPHVHRLFGALRLAPTTVKEMEPLMDICHHCLSNRKGVKAMSATELMACPMFAEFRASDGLAEAIVEQWVMKN